jgi:hypothetical protein
MIRISRNAPCHCGSGKKYKRCCGVLANSMKPTSVGTERAALEAQRADAQEYRRRLMQGLGRPIVSFLSHGYRCVAVGDECRWSKTWETFPDFLFDYIKILLTPEWGDAELAKPEAERHTLLHWYKKVCEFQRSAEEKSAQGVYTARMTGAVRGYLCLAYDLYLCAHNEHVQDVLLDRLRDGAQFEGALYEAHVIGCFAKAGFSIAFENEGDPTRSHCEFTATHQVTGKKFSVEAKAVSSNSQRAGSSSEPPWIRHQLAKALRKNAAYDRIVFIELNRAELADENSPPPWVAKVIGDIRQAEVDLLIDGKPAPAAYLLLTNRGFIHALDSTKWSEFGIMEGFKIEDFPADRGAISPLDSYKARERHIEVHWLLKAIETHHEIPITFDSRTPEEAFAAEPIQRPRIGDTHVVLDGLGNEVPGILMSAVMVEESSSVFAQYRLSESKFITCTFPVSEAELAVYRRQPDTFFEAILPVSKGLKTPLDCSDFVAKTYLQTPREKLLEFMAEWPDIEQLQTLPQKELAEAYCNRLAESIWNNHQKSKPH